MSDRLSFGDITDPWDRTRQEREALRQIATEGRGIDDFFTSQEEQDDAPAS